MKYLNYVICLLLPCYFGLIAQPANDNCNTPIRIKDITKYCSAVAEFSNVNATPSGYGPATCWVGAGNDVWFTFRAFYTDVSITVVGRNPTTGQSGGTLVAPQVALYTGICGNVLSERQCGADRTNRGIVNINEAGLTVGQDFFIRVSGVNGQQGTFQLCINNFNSPIEPGQDCISASVLCEKVPFVNKKLSGNGRFPDEALHSCLGETNGFGQTSEQQSVWYTWTAANNGTLTFELNPLNPGDDLDFALYELPSGILNCNDKKLLRCNATAPFNFQTGRNCGTRTGLDLTSTDISENFNCDAGEDGFCKYIDMEAGKAYALIINNFTNTGIGFSIDWGGTGLFLGPEPSFAVFPDTGLRCETDFRIIDNSKFSSALGTPRYFWNFGKDAQPATASGPGPFQVRYNSFGDKFITMTMELGGCKVTEIKRLYAEPCCEDLPTLNLLLDSIRHLTCYKSNDGKISVKAELGTPFKENSGGSIVSYYQFSLDKLNYSPIKDFVGFAKGSYQIYVQDAKGCEDSLVVQITEPTPITADAGEDREIDLGDAIDLAGSASPGGNYRYEWIGDSVECKNCQNTKAIPFKDGYYRFKAVNESGCAGIDSIYIRVRRNYDVWAPNVFSPNGDGLNEYFRVWGGKSLHSIELLEIYDRWGGVMYRGTNISPDHPASGWKGNFGDSDLNPGVYVYRARVRFLDGVVKELAGDITLLR